MNKTVINKNNGKKYYVFDITYNKRGYAQFLIYKDNQWIRMSAKHFRPYTKEDYEKELKDLKNLYVKDTLGFASYDA